MSGKLARTIAALRECAAAGMTASEAAVRVGRIRQYVLSLARQNGIKFKRGPVVERARRGSTARSEAMARLYRDGKTLAEIGAVYSITRERVRQIISRQEGLRGKDGGQAKTVAQKRIQRSAERDARYYAKHGCSLAQYLWLLKVKRALRPFVQQRTNAAIRGIGWDLNLWQWWTIWQQSGHWAERGRGQGYCMCRHGDLGPYAAGNVFIAKSTENSSNQAKKKSGLPMGVVRVKRGNYERYSAKRMVAGVKYDLGHFKTPDLAHAAYLSFVPPAQAVAA